VLARGRDVVKSVTYYRRAMLLDPSDAQTWDDYARVAQDAGRTDEAKAAFEQAALKSEREGAEEIHYWAIDGKGDIALAQGNLPEALRSYRSAQEPMNRLAKADPNNAGWQYDLSVSYANLANLYRRRGEAALAKDALSKGKAIMERMTKLSPDNAAWKKDLAWFEGQIAALGK
jgi:tetratricopeptide (TPR) repeat protein